MLCKSRNWNNNSNDWKDNNIRTGGTDQECEHYNKTFNQTVCFLAQENNTIYEGEKTKQEKERKKGRKKGESEAGKRGPLLFFLPGMNEHCVRQDTSLCSPALLRRREEGSSITGEEMLFSIIGYSSDSTYFIT